VESHVNTEALIIDFAIRCFRDEGDEVYIAARMAFRAGLAANSLWGSQQTVEKYLKCILLLNRIPGKRVLHDLSKALNLIKTSDKILLDLSPRTMNFIERIDEIGRFRYLEVSRVAYGLDIVNLDRAVWELRRYCTLSEAPRLVKLRQGVIAPKYRLDGGYLEKVMDDTEDPAHEPLLWNNAFLGRRRRRKISMKTWLKATNAPLYLNPQILGEILKYIHLPDYLIDGYRAHKKPD
jgi:HEPN domain-containing protein